MELTVSCSLQPQLIAEAPEAEQLVLVQASPDVRNDVWLEDASLDVDAQLFKLELFFSCHIEYLCVRVDAPYLFCKLVPRHLWHVRVRKNQVVFPAPCRLPCCSAVCIRIDLCLREDLVHGIQYGCP